MPVADLTISPIPARLDLRLALLGMTAPPDSVAHYLDAQGWQALDDLRAAVYAQVKDGTISTRTIIAPMVQRLNLSLRRNGFGAGWALAADIIPPRRIARHGRDLWDVAAMWGLEHLERHYGSWKLASTGPVKVQRQAQKIGAAVRDLSEKIEHVSGFGQPIAKPIPTKRIDAAWRKLEAELADPSAPTIDWQLVIHAAPYSGPELGKVLTFPQIEPIAERRDAK